MQKRISWTVKLGDGIKRETRVEVCRGSIKWQFKRSDEESWDYDSPPTSEDWDTLEDILKRRSGRGRATSMIAAFQKMRPGAGT